MEKSPFLGVLTSHDYIWRVSDWAIAVFLGAIQGLTEFLPISSTAHIFLVSEIFGWGDPGAAYTAVLQLGTETAVLLYFWRDIKTLLLALLKSIKYRRIKYSQDSTLAWALISGSLPIGFFGLLLRDYIENDIRNLQVVASALIFFGLVLIFVEKFTFPRLSNLSIKSGILMGFAQALALIPGVSRSGATISAGLLLGLERRVATRYAFLLAVPAVFASGFFELNSALTDHSYVELQFSTWQILFSTFISFVVGLLVISGLMRFLAKYTFTAFGVYRVVLGSALLILAGLGVIGSGA